MKVLALDLSSSRGSVAVAEETTIIGELTFPCERGRGGGAFAALQELRPLWRGAGVIAVGIGPGSYNGLRTACALAQSMQMATGAKLCAMASPCLLPVGHAHFAVYGDARGGRAYRAEVREGKLCAEITLLDHAAAAAQAEVDNFPCYRVGPLPGLEHFPEAHPEAAILASRALQLTPVEARSLQPLYLKPPHITLPRVPRT